MTVYDNLGLFPFARGGVTRAETDRRVEEALGPQCASPGYGGALSPAQLSGGQQQRVGPRARRPPRLRAARPLLMDEPLRPRLDKKLAPSRCSSRSSTIQRELRLTVIYVTHGPGRGRWTMSGPDRRHAPGVGSCSWVGPKDLYERPADQFVARLPSASRTFLEVTVRAVEGRVSPRR